jgi:hypothetical protein
MNFIILENTGLIYSKLESFMKKFYTNELLRGTLFFIGLGLLYFLFTLFIEYFLWLPPLGRTFLFWLFVVVEVVLLFRFILFPLFKLVKLQKGIQFDEASKIIGNHFGEVSDKLTNFLQLAEDKNQSELLLASIEQKAATLHPIPFNNAINLNKNLKYLPWAIVPLLFILFFVVSGRSDVITQSFNRVVNYNERFTPPAPFHFTVVNDNLTTEQGKDFVLQIKTIGKLTPEKTMIFMNNESYYMETVEPGVFEYRFNKPVKDVVFHLEANAVSSTNYALQVITVPSIADFDMYLQFPAHTGRKQEVVKGSGNAIIPEGTVVSWKVNAIATKKITWNSSSEQGVFEGKDNWFVFSKRINQNTDYQIATSNSNVKDYEKLAYQLSIIKDEYPTISVNVAPDKLQLESNVLVGQISDDYGLSKLQIVYYPKNNEKQANKASIAIKKDVFDQFVFSFPGDLPLEPGVAYDYYFEVFDNDALHNFKSTKSTVFNDRLATDEENIQEQFRQQNQNINSLEKSIKTQEKQLTELENLQKIGKEKNALEYKDQQKINDFIQRQKQQEEMMKEFSKKLEKNIDAVKSDKNDEFKEQLKERLDKANKEADKNQKLLDELEKLSQKLNQEELFEKIDQFKQGSKNQTKSLEQLVELTKKYYVERKAQQLADKLSKLADKQMELSKKDTENTADKQKEINEDFDELQEELQQLDKDNKDLKAPLDLPENDSEKKSIDEDLNKAKEELQKQQTSKAKPKQQNASQKMKQMSQKMMEEMAGAEMEQLQEDVKMLRQILDNLLAFSFSQEDLMKQFKGLKKGSPSFNKNLKMQQDLKLQFKHVDDSLFAMSLRNPKIGEKVTFEIGNVHYNVDKSIESFVDVQMPKGISHQQYTVNSANILADLLSDVLNSMQMSMSGMGQGGKPKPGQGKGAGMQLPDIIQKQEGLSKKMGDGMKKSEKPGDGKDGDKGNKPGSKEGGKQSGNKPGESGSGGQDGNDGEENARELMEIYKEQRRLREQLQNVLDKEGLTPNGQRVLDQMKDAEKQILNKGFKNEVFQRLLNIKHEMLKLEKALQQQGDDSKRESNFNNKDYVTPVSTISKELQDYLNSVEILNRQTLPLRPNYNQKVQQYFKND